jgi:hypothetical protein
VTMTTDLQSESEQDVFFLVSILADAERPFDARLLIGAINGRYCLCCGRAITARLGERAGGLVIRAPTGLFTHEDGAAWRTVGGICELCADASERERVAAAGRVIRYFNALDALCSIDMQAADRLADYMRSLPYDRRRFFDLDAAERFISCVRGRLVVDPDEVELLLAAIDPELGYSDPSSEWR